MTNDIFQIEHITRLISHYIQPKTSTKEAEAKTSEALLKFSPEDKNILINRLQTALINTKKTFKLSFENKSNASVYHFLNQKKATDIEFIQYSQKLADDLAAAHFRINIPGGFCLIGEGQTQKRMNVFFIIKAELQEVFSITQNNLKTIKDVFLSPAKDFYKIAYFVQENRSYTPFMFDDQFSLQKKDLTEYFYSHFLGLTTDKNDSLKSKNFYTDTKSFLENNVDNAHDRVGLINALNVLYREDTSGILSAKEFSENYLEGDLKNKFDSVISKKYPHSFSKDISLLENKLELSRISIPLSASIAIVGDSQSMSNIDIIDRINSDTIKIIEPQINNGSINKIIMLKQERSN